MEFFILFFMLIFLVLVHFVLSFGRNDILLRYGLSQIIPRLTIRTTPHSPRYVYTCVCERVNDAIFN